MAAPEEESNPDMSVILIEFLVPTLLVMNLAVSLAYPLGIFNVPSVLILTLVMIYLEESALNAYRMGVPVGKRAARLDPLIVVVPLLYSFREEAELDSERVFPLASQALTLMAPPEEDREPDISVTLIELLEPTEFVYAQAACVTVNVCPAIVIVPVLMLLVELAKTL